MEEPTQNNFQAIEIPIVLNEIIELDSTMKIKAYDTFLNETKKNDN